MFCKYKVNLKATIDTVTADLLAIITGQSDTQALSIGCDKSNTELLTDVVTNWTLHDQVSSTKFVVKAKEANGLLDKFVMVEVTASNVNIAVYETWNATTHTGTNLAGNNVVSMAYTSLLNITIYVLCKREYLIIRVKDGNTWASTIPLSLEMTRDDLWNTPQFGYPVHVFCQDFNMLTLNVLERTYKNRIYLPRLKGETSDLTGFNAYLQLESPFGNALNNEQTNAPDYHGVAAWNTISFTESIGVGLPRDADFKPLITTLFEMRFFRSVSTTYAFMGGTIIGGIRLTPAIFGSTGDELIINNKTYFAINNVSTPNTYYPIGYRTNLLLLVPKE